MSIRFGNRLVGDGNPCCIVYEIGPTHNGLDSAKRLVKFAAEAGADAVKFQIIDPDRLVADKSLMFSYDILLDKATGKTETIEEPLYDILTRRALSHTEWRTLKLYADSLNLAFFATVGFDDEVNFLESLDCDSVKIASSDVNHYPLLRRAARTGMCLQLDTGNATIGEIEGAVDVIRSEGNENIIIHQCPSGYPARLESINLNIIKTLKQFFPYPVAYSDHTPGWEMDVAALALGANLLEKTITENRLTRSVEHIFSLEPNEMKAFIQVIRDVEKAFGQPRRILHAEELAKRKRYRRSAYFKTSVKAGQRLGDVQIEFCRPGFGITPDVYESLRDAVLVRDVSAGTLLNYDCIAMNTSL